MYYGDSLTLKKLQYYPLALLLIILLFILVLYFVFKTSKISEQNRLWAGMARETAHQIGTPLTSMMGWITLLKEKKNVLTALRKETSWRFYDGGCVSYVSLVRGLLDICIDGNLDPFDFCALVPIVNGAGGKITDWSGKPLNINSGSRIVASGTVSLHEKVLQYLED